MTILVAATVPAFLMDSDWKYWGNWLDNVSAFDCEERVILLVTEEVDGRGIKHFEPLNSSMDTIAEEEGWSSFGMAYSIQDGGTEATSHSRLSRICTGRNLISEFAQQRRDITHILHLDADVRAADNLLVKLLEMDTGICGAEVPTYCLSGPPAPEAMFPQSWNVQEHMNTAGCLLVRRDVFRAIRWRWDAEADMTDDPCYYADAKLMGHPTYVRHDVKCTHYPEVLPPLEARGHDRTYY